jgi:hypothetical protein
MLIKCIVYRDQVLNVVLSQHYGFHKPKFFFHVPIVVCDLSEKKTIKILIIPD